MAFKFYLEALGLVAHGHSPPSQQLEKPKRIKRQREDSDFEYEDYKPVRSSSSSFKGDNVVIPREKGRGVQLKEMKAPCRMHPNCKLLEEVGRVAIRQHVEQMNYQELQGFVKSTVICSKFEGAENGRYARKNANEYHLSWKGEDFIVCRSMYINTVGITPWTIRNWLGENPNYMPAAVRDGDKENIDLTFIKDEFEADETPKVKKKDEFEADETPKAKKRAVPRQYSKVARTPRASQSKPYKFKKVLLERYLKEVKESVSA